MTQIELIITKNTDEDLRRLMSEHYSQPRGFVGRNICYAIYYDDVFYGYIVSGGAVRDLPGRHEFLDTNDNRLNRIINNVFYSVNKVNGRYPIRNFTSEVVKEWMRIAPTHWKIKYGNTVLGFETLVELPRTGELYKKAGFIVVGQTKGYTCKRVPGVSTDSWTGKRVWNTKELKPKLVLCKKNAE